ncbi:MAG: DUF839 domain-containing protein [Myxococcales bacterium]|nr:DUF839 domain-containing protein [Myxococcales bacterium]
MKHDKRDERPKATVNRRAMLRSGLAGFASIMAGKALAACAPPAGPSDSGVDALTGDAATDASGSLDAMDAMDVTSIADSGVAIDARPVDSGIDAGAQVFRRRTLPAPPALRSRIADIGPLSATPDANGLRLPAGFTSRIVGEYDRPVPGTSHLWHVAPDGGATFGTEDGGWIYVSNSEQLAAQGGVGAIRFAGDGTIMRAYTILRRTTLNCAGGRTPWHTWLSCEEMDRGRVWECDPWGEQPSVARPALGVFIHEAVCVDHDRGHLYLTEDANNGRFYRFVPAGTNANGFPDLSRGVLEVAVVDRMGGVTWRPVPDPTYTGDTPTRYQVPESTEFDGGEGIWYVDHKVYFSTKGDDRIWLYDCRTSRISIFYDFQRYPEPRILTGVDNLTVSCCGDLLVAEDQGTMDVVAILPSGDLKQLVQVVGQDTSEITGPAFDPSGTRLYFSSQRSPAGGTTFEVTGPFHAPA